MSTPAPYNLGALRKMLGMLLADISDTKKRGYLTNLNPMVTPVNIEYYIESSKALDTMVRETIILILLCENKDDQD